MVAGAPPKIIHIMTGNCSLDVMAATLLDNAGHIREFLEHESKAHLLIP